MKVVIFCGGQGMRMREASETVPKPMILIGNRPILWHIMKYYAHFGFRDFVGTLSAGWARYGEVLRYDATTDQLFCDLDRAAPPAPSAP